MSLREALEAALIEDPSDDAAHHAYGDHLAEQGDPRGELIQTQIALESLAHPPERLAALKARLKELLSRHRAEWLGPLAPLLIREGKNREWDFVERDEAFGLTHVNYADFDHSFTRGWLDTLVLPKSNPRVMEALASCPTAALLGELEVWDCDPERETLDALAGLPFLPRLRNFQIGRDGVEFRLDGAGVEAAVARMTRVFALNLFADNVDVRAVCSTPLRSLYHLRMTRLRACPLEALAGNTGLWNLRHLDLYPAGGGDGTGRAILTLAGLRALLRSPHAAKLSSLHLHRTDFGDEGVAAIVESGVLRTLVTLDLHWGTITDAGARTLAASPDIAHPHTLNVGRNALTPAGLAALRAAGARLDLSDAQYTPAEVAAGEHLGDEED